VFVSEVWVLASYAQLPDDKTLFILSRTNLGDFQHWQQKEE
jgi:hypothetical protein